MTIQVRIALTVAACALPAGAAPAAAHATADPRPSIPPATSNPATGNGAWSVGPANRSGAPAARPYFALEARPGAVVHDLVRIANLTDRRLTFSLYGADAYNTPRDAGFALRTAAEPRTDVGRWIRLGTGKTVIQPRTAREIPFTISVPLNATPGSTSAESSRSTRPSRPSRRTARPGSGCVAPSRRASTCASPGRRRPASGWTRSRSPAVSPWSRW
ncbi:hypothetical protein ACFQHO_01675 [Actinomadura yumaensis]|uniref:hypothetical protein n=1 Tax=Actinomadura yumaensis TaxID=111807 RepID=UPI0036115B39